MFIDVAAGFTAAEAGIIQAQDGIVDVTELFPLEGGLAAGFFHGEAQGASHFEGQLSLSRSRFTHQQQRFLQGNGEIYNSSQFRVEIVTIGSLKIHSPCSPKPG